MQYFGHDVAVLRAARLGGLNYRTVHRLGELMRRRVVALAVSESAALDGEVESDESYFGPTPGAGRMSI